MQQSVERAQQQAIKWLIIPNRVKSLENKELNGEDTCLKLLAYLLNLLPFFLRHNIIMALWFIAHHPTLILSWQAWPKQRNSWRTCKWSKFALQLICNYANLPCRSCGRIQKGGKTLQSDLEPCTHCPHSWARFVLLLRSQVLKNISEQSNV